MENPLEKISSGALRGSTCRAEVRRASDGRLGLVADAGQQACAGCAGACGLLTGARNRTIGCDALLPASASCGDKVVARLPEGGLARLAALCFLFPALLIVSGAAVAAGFSASGGDAAAVFGALGGLAIGVALLRLYDSRGGGEYWISRVQLEPINRFTRSQRS